VRCGLCPRRCVVPDGGRGYCRVRANRGGRYVTLVYGRPCAANLDPIEKKPFFHVYPGSQAYSIATVGCNMHCRFCQNWDIAQASPEDAPVPYRGPEDVAAEAARLKARTIAYTYSEPTIFYEYLADCARAGRERGIESVMVSNGFIADAPQRALFPLMKAIKIDLKAFTQSFYGEICDGVLEPVLETLKRLAGSGVWYEIVVLVIPTLNDGADEIARMSAWIVKALGPEVPVHFSRYHPMYRLRNLPPTPEATLLKARETARKEGCRFVYIGNVPGTEGQDTVCPGCGKTIIRRYGYRIEANHIRDGKCTFCGRAIPGVWG
jgi:pyruvate formate lyase activating enzyme